TAAPSRGAPESLLGCRADDAEVARRAGRVRRRRFEALRKDSLGYFEHRLGDPVAICFVALDGHLGVVEYVVVGLLGGVELPGLARAHGVERELYVDLQLRR